jgi:hypothetical protein
MLKNWINIFYYIKNNKLSPLNVFWSLVLTCRIDFSQSYIGTMSKVTTLGIRNHFSSCKWSAHDRVFLAYNVIPLGETLKAEIHLKSILLQFSARLQRCANWVQRQERAVQKIQNRKNFFPFPFSKGGVQKNSLKKNKNRYAISEQTKLIFWWWK